MQVLEGSLFIIIAENPAPVDKALKVAIGDVVKFLRSEIDELFLAESLVTKKQGLVYANSCHYICEPLTYTSFRNAHDRKKRKESELNDIISHEQAFIHAQGTFIEVVVKQLLRRDTHFKRTVLGDPAFAVCITLIQEIHHATTIFLTELRHATTNEKVAETFERFAPSLQLFAQFVSENSNAFNTLKQHQKAFHAFLDSNPLPEMLSMEQCLIMPLQHFKRYRPMLQSYVVLTDPAEPGFMQLINALYAIVTQTEDVDTRLKEEESNIQLLSIQNQFAGNVNIFKQGRRLIREIMVERVRTAKVAKDGPEIKDYYIHLFNDCLIYSTKKYALGEHYFKMKKILDLFSLCLVLEPETTFGLSNVMTFKLIDDAEFSISFRFPEDANPSEWLEIISSLTTIDAKNDRRQTKASTVVNTIPGINPSNFGSRVSCIYTFLQTESAFAQLMGQMYIVLIKPLINSSKGAMLEAGVISIGEDQPKGPMKNNRRGSTINKGLIQQVTDALQDADVQVYLRAAEGLAISLKDFSASIIAQCKQSNWSENTCIGNLFTSSSATALYNQYKSYASGQEAMLRTLRSYAFSSFYVEAENNLCLGRGKLAEQVQLIRRRIEDYLKFLQELVLVTPQSHSDYKPLIIALQNLNSESIEVSEVIKNRLNFEKLLEIQKGFTSVSMFGSDPFVAKIASYDRVLLKEGELKKVCRKKNKNFKFWLFNDYLIYGEYVGNGSYTLNRYLDLSKCTVAEHKGELKDAFEIFGTEKSFVVIAKNSAIQMEWITAITKAIEAIRPAESFESTNVAPVWVPDSASDSCTICQQGFTMWRRRHHCRQCGSLVCGEHSTHQIILAHINDTRKQRVCDRCYANQGKNDSSFASRADASKRGFISERLDSSDSKSRPFVNESKQGNAQLHRYSMPNTPPPPVPPPPVPSLPSDSEAVDLSVPRMRTNGHSTSQEQTYHGKEAIPSSIVSSNLAAFQAKTEQPRQTSPKPTPQASSSIQDRVAAYKANAASSSQSPSASPSRSPMPVRKLSPKAEEPSDPSKRQFPAKFKHVVAEPTIAPPPLPERVAVTAIVADENKGSSEPKTEIIVKPVEKPYPFKTARRVSVAAPPPTAANAVESVPIRDLSQLKVSSPEVNEEESRQSLQRRRVAPPPAQHSGESQVSQAVSQPDSTINLPPPVNSITTDAAVSRRFPTSISPPKVSQPKGPAESTSVTPPPRPPKRTSNSKDSDLPKQTAPVESREPESISQRSISPKPVSLRPAPPPPIPFSQKQSSDQENIPTQNSPKLALPQSPPLSPPRAQLSQSADPGGNHESSNPSTSPLSGPPPLPVPDVEISELEGRDIQRPLSVKPSQSSRPAPPPPPRPPPPPPPRVKLQEAGEATALVTSFVPTVDGSRTDITSHDAPSFTPSPPTLSKPQPVEDPALRKYRILKDSLPAGAVRQKMKMDGISDNDIDRFLGGEIIEKLSVESAKPMSIDALDIASFSLKSTQVAEKPKGRRASILDEIQLGPKLKALQRDDNRMKPAQSNAGGLLGSLAVEMFKRRVNMRQDEDVDSDGSGFSGSDSDSD